MTIDFRQRYALSYSSFYGSQIDESKIWGLIQVLKQHLPCNTQVTERRPVIKDTKVRRFLFGEAF